MIKKVRRRLSVAGQTGGEEVRAWLSEVAIPVEDLVPAEHRSLWDEAQGYSTAAAEDSARVLSEIPYKLGGGGHYPLLYFVTRLSQPDVVVETGVAAGYSSRAVLTALKRNGRGHLWSSDFPYFRLPNPERFIGVVVPADLRDRWTLEVNGDELNLPRILSRVHKVDVFHYDSDKSYEGRRYAMEVVGDYLHADSHVLMDDIQDNSYFHDYVATRQAPYAVVEFQGKYVGVLGPLANRLNAA